MLTDRVLLQGHSLRLGLADKSVHAICTSPPYLAHREYLVPPRAWPPVPNFCPMPGLDRFDIHGCDPECEHEWGDVGKLHLRGPRKEGDLQPDRGRVMDVSTGRFCQKCWGWSGHLGQEPSPQMYIAHLVAISREFWRVLRDDGIYWLNLGDTYAANRSHQVSQTNVRSMSSDIARNVPPGLKEKDLVGVPWRAAFALQADGWYLRICNIWAKGRDGDVGDDGYGSAMPMSRTDAPTLTHEQVLMLTKRPQYHYDEQAVRAHWIDWSEKNPEKRNRSHDLRSVWIIPPEPYSGSHFASFPTGLPELCLRASLSKRGVCPECGTPWERVVEKRGPTTREMLDQRGAAPYSEGQPKRGQALNFVGYRQGDIRQAQTAGWVPGCGCYGHPERGPVPCTKCGGTGKGMKYLRGGQDWTSGTAKDGQPQRDSRGGLSNVPPVETGEPCPKCGGEGVIEGDIWPDNIDEWPVAPSIVLDPFAGTARTGAAARRVKGPISFVGVDLSEEYLQEHAAKTLNLKKAEMGKEGGIQTDPEEDGLSSLPLFAGI